MAWEVAERHRVRFTEGSASVYSGAVFNGLRLWCTTWWHDLGRGGRTFGSECHAHHHRYNRRQLRGCPWRPASCLRAAPPAAQGGGVSGGTLGRRLELGGRSGAGIGQPICLRLPQERRAAEEASGQGDQEAGCQADPCNQGSRRVAGCEVDGPESLQQEGRSTCACLWPTRSTGEAVRIRRRGQHCTARTIGDCSCLGSGTRDAGTKAGADARQGDLRLLGGTQRLRRRPRVAHSAH